MEWREHTHYSCQYVYSAGNLYSNGNRSEWMYCHEQHYTHAGYYSTDSIDYEQYEYNDLDLFSDKH